MKCANEYMEIHTAFLSILVCIGIIFNILYLMSLKAENTSFDSTRKIQCLKTTFILLALVLYFPSEMFVMHVHTDFIYCLLKDIFQTFFLDSYPVGIFVISILHLQIISSQPLSNIGVSKAAYLLCGVGFLFVQLTCAMMELLNHPIDVLFEIRNMTNVQPMAHCKVHKRFDYTFIHDLVVYEIIPIITIIIYARILTISFGSSRRIRPMNCDQSGGMSEQEPERRISNANIYSTISVHSIGSLSRPNVNAHVNRDVTVRRSVITILAPILFTAIPVGITEIYGSFGEINENFDVFLLYLKTIMCIGHAIGEGIFYSNKRKRIKMFMAKFCGVSLSPNPTRANEYIGRVTDGNDIDQQIYARPVFLSTLREESDTSVQPIDDDVFMVDHFMSKLERPEKIIKRSKSLEIIVFRTGNLIKDDKSSYRRSRSQGVDDENHATSHANWMQTRRTSLPGAISYQPSPNQSPLKTVTKLTEEGVSREGSRLSHLRRTSSTRLVRTPFGAHPKMSVGFGDVQLNHRRSIMTPFDLLDYRRPSTCRLVGLSSISDVLAGHTDTEPETDVTVQQPSLSCLDDLESSTISK